MMLTPSNDFDPIYFMDLPSPLNYYEFDGSIFHGHDQSFIVGNDISQSPTINEPIVSTPSKMVMSKGDIVNEITVQQDYVSNKKVSGRGPYKGDRHSKIPTAHGLRDRRMRLSLDVARQFFKLQDMLSFDKPSKTVKWLLLQAKSAIEEMGKAKESPSADATKCASSTSEGEVVESAIDEEIINDHQKAAISKGKVKRARKNVAASPPVPKQVKKKAREEARERARERTHKKNQAKLFEGTHGLGDDSGSQTHNMKPSSDVIFEIEQHFQEERNHFQSTDQGFPTTNWNSMMSLSYHQEAQEGDACQINPIQEFHQTPREPYSHPHLGQYWYF